MSCVRAEVEESGVRRRRGQRANGESVPLWSGAGCPTHHCGKPLASVRSGQGERESVVGWGVWVREGAVCV